MRRHWPALGRSATEEKKNVCTVMRPLLDTCYLKLLLSEVNGHFLFFYKTYFHYNDLPLNYKTEKFQGISMLTMMDLFHLFKSSL